MTTTPTEITTSSDSEAESLTETTVSADTAAVLAAPPMPRALIRRRIKADQNGVLIAATLMALLGWGALYVLIMSVPPLALYRWLFFILLYLAVTGTVLPFIWYLNNRFSGARPVMGGTILREGMWCGLVAITVAWLQMIRAANGALAFFLALSFLVIEIFLRVRETRS
ncbi:MAG: hypothetical protein KF726_00955 [Anaerolineae bacterium]|nr:hypothetical protein [Anaerolineae bacterium]